jgi:hypothetical protein
MVYANKIVSITTEPEAPAAEKLSVLRFRFGTCGTRCFIGAYRLPHRCQPHMLRAIGERYAFGNGAFCSAAKRPVYTELRVYFSIVGHVSKSVV